ncbi:MAG: cyanophycinase [Flavobacteriales bacterium]|jgi:cyanophycinase|nr:cyanophycinase [Flavobacteriales bacterium]MBK6893785.1 cyanophycinase [Flavobacteriales bacterium]MBK7247739.1 cyanophycinase [Flavobacteriales bacterium]MBK7288319.1 cyanophycinase [Flavobacteriales bacterium]MBK9060426.1 cyanophycinase [Flavobacteriales bacterium]
MNNTPKGKLIAIGGAEDKGNEQEKPGADSGTFIEDSILRRVVDEMGGHHAARIALVTTASSIPREVAANYVEAFGKLGVTDLDILDIRERSDVKPDMVKRLSKADGVMMSGGNQLRLTTIFGGTAFLELMKRRYMNEVGYVVAGTSAGAMCMSSTMIYQGHSSTGLIKGGVKMTSGAGFIGDVIIDSHFVQRGRFSRLTQAIAGNPNAIGIGLGEDTGVVITEGENLETIGSGQVMIFDGHEISYSNFADVEEGATFSIEGMRVHIISKGHCYSLRERAFTAVRVPV